MHDTFSIVSHNFCGPIRWFWTRRCSAVEIRIWRDFGMMLILFRWMLFTLIWFMYFKIIFISEIYLFHAKNWFFFVDSRRYCRRSLVIVSSLLLVVQPNKGKSNECLHYLCRYDVPPACAGDTKTKRFQSTRIKLWT